MENPVDLEYSWFIKKLQEVTGINLGGYKPDQMKRLLGRTMQQAGADNYVNCIKILQEHPEGAAAFLDSVTINVSYLFRDKDRWAQLSAHLLAELSSPERKGKLFRVWSAGCSIGAEPATLSIILNDLACSGKCGHFKYNILATDIDNSVLDRARAGIYSDKEVTYVPPGFMARYFVETPRPESGWAIKNTAQSFYKIKPALLSAIEYRKHNIFDELHEKEFDLIVCRNVIIYFTREVTDKLISKFGGYLLPGSLLFIGGTELIFNPESLGLVNLTGGIYRKNK